MFSNVFKYNFLIMIRQKPLLFWSLLFPLLMSILFSMAFKNLYGGELIREEIPVAIVASSEKNPLYDLKEILSSIPRKEGSGDKMFRIEAMDEASARQQVRDKKVVAAVLDGPTPQMLVNKVDLQQAVLKQVLDQVSAVRNTVTTLIREKPASALHNLPRKLSQGNYISQQSIAQERMKPEIVHFYALLAMGCLSAVTSGAAMLFTQQANKSPEGARSSIAPANKWLRVAASGLASYLVQLTLSLVVYAFMRYVLGHHFGDQPLYILMVIALGTLAGFLMGTTIACVMRGSLNAVLGMTVGIYLFSSFLTGLMGSPIKRLVDTQLPWLAAINPGSMIVNAFYSLYYYRSPDYRYLLHLLLLSLFFAGITALTLRRRYHDSI